jgi:uncharacterized membrane protein YidH (DUF202 family)
MKLLVILGILLIAAGALIIAYHGFSFNKNQKIAQVGDLKIKTTTPIYLSPTAGGIIIGIGVLLLLFSSL